MILERIFTRDHFLRYNHNFACLDRHPTCRRERLKAFLTAATRRRRRVRRRVKRNLAQVIVSPKMIVREYSHRVRLPPLRPPLKCEGYQTDSVEGKLTCPNVPAQSATNTKRDLETAYLRNSLPKRLGVPKNCVSSTANAQNQNSACVLVPRSCCTFSQQCQCHQTLGPPFLRTP